MASKYAYDEFSRCVFWVLSWKMEVCAAKPYSRTETARKPSYGFTEGGLTLERDGACDLWKRRAKMIDDVVWQFSYSHLTDS
jgi:hypothetical protein